MKLLFAGDIYFGENSENLDEIDVSEINEIISEKDYFISNLESPIGNKEKYVPILKTGPNLIANEGVISFLKKIGIDGVSVANNHIGDYGEKAVIDTLELLRGNDIKYIGAGKDIEEAYEAIQLEKDGISVSIIASCENEFGIATNSKVGASGYNESLLSRRIQEEKEKSDYVIIFFHGGNEFNPFPTPYAKKRYHNMIDCGASVVIATHTHCPQGYEYYGDGFIAYSMGNFYYPTSKSAYDLWNMGYMCQICLENKLNIKILPYRYSNYQKKVKILVENHDYIEYLNEISKPIMDDDLLEKLFCIWTMNKGGIVYSHLMDWSHPSQKNALEIQNILRCESHREMMIKYFENVFSYPFVEKKYTDLVDSKYVRMPLSDLNFKEELTDNEYVLYKHIKDEKQVCLFGCIRKNVDVIQYIEIIKPEIDIILIDNDISKKGHYFQGVIVNSVKDVVEKYKSRIKYIVFNGRYSDEMSSQLLKYGIEVTSILLIDF